MALDLLKKLIRRDGQGDAPAAQTGPAPHRRVTLLGPDPSCSAELARQLFQAERGGFHPLTPAGGSSPRFDLATAAPDGAPDDAVRVAAMHVSGFRRAERPRRWEICVPRSLQVAGRDPRTWKMSTDTIVVAWPQAWLERSGPDVERMNLELIAAINEAGQAGRLKRVLFVVCLSGEGWRPGHRDQARLSCSRGTGFRRALGVELSQSKDHPGDPLADPEFRKFLTDTLLKSVAFVEVVDNAMLLLNRECPVYLVAPAEGEALADALAWIRHPAPAGPRRNSAPLHVALGLAAAWYVVAMLGALSYPRPLGVENVNAHTIGTLDRQIADRLQGYERIPAKAGTLVVGNGGQIALHDLRSELSDKLAVRRHVDEVQRALGRARVNAARAPLAERLVRAHELLNLAEAELGDRASWLDRHAEDASEPARLAAWDDALADALFQAALLGMVPQGSGFAGFKLVDEPFSARVHEGLQRLNAQEQMARLDVLLAQPDPAKFYAEAWVRGTLDVASMQRWAQPADSVLPRLTEQNHADARWGRLRLAMGSECYGRYVLNGVGVGPGPGLEPGPRPMTLTIRAVGLESHWHVDARAYGGELVFGKLNPDGSCVIRLERVTPGAPVSLFLNPNTSHHTWTSESKRCEGSIEQAFTLASPTGDLVFPGGQKIHYEVTAGWEAGGVATAGAGQP